MTPTMTLDGSLALSNNALMVLPQRWPSFLKTQDQGGISECEYAKSYNKPRWDDIPR